MQRIESEQEQQKRRGQGTGYLYNDFAGSGHRGATDNVLHLAGCPMLANASGKGAPKYFSDGREQAVRWLTATRGQEGKHWKYCGYCWRRSTG